MKIGLIADIHVDENHAYPVLEAIEDLIRKKNIEMLLIAGDISEDYRRSISTAAKLRKQSGVPVYYVPGNHDLWNKHYPGLDSEKISRIFAEDPFCLSGRCIESKADKGSIIGETGWYDYSLADRKYTRTELDRMSLLGRTWHDHLFNCWTHDNPGKNQEMLDRMKSSLERCQGSEIIAVTHMIPREEFAVPQEREGWGYFNAFLGSSSYGKLYMKYPVRHAVFGHVHFRKTLNADQIVWHCPCLGYFSEWERFAPGKPLEDQVAMALQVID
ncbi:MAG: metallophosphoesterase [Solobacterium sp.]|jgi:putative phosphoesterase|nr:metallophosphoesterase [Solobacterium sp.]